MSSRLSFQFAHTTAVIAVKAGMTAFGDLRWLSHAIRLSYAPRQALARSRCNSLCSPTMKRLTQAPNLAIATLWADALTRAGFDVTVQRAFLAGGIGDLAPDQCLPEIWLTEPAQETRARDVLYDLQHVPQRRWGCVCGELVEGGFEQCWSCGAMMKA
jgi:hypothetical protein